MNSNTAKLLPDKILYYSGAFVILLLLEIICCINPVIAATDLMQDQDKQIQKDAQLATLGTVVLDNLNFSETVKTNSGIDRVQTTIYWVWWWGALALGFITVGFWWFLRVPLGVAGSWDRVVGWRKEQHRAIEESKVHGARKDQIMDALMAETIAQFGEQAVVETTATPSIAPSIAESQIEDTMVEVPYRAPWQSHITFLVSMGIGALLSVLWGSGFTIQWTLGPEFTRLFGEGWHQWIILFFGGICVGFGIRLGSGCTSGHGLSGLSQYQLGSLVCTMAFFGAAIMVSLLLESIS